VKALADNDHRRVSEFTQRLCPDRLFGFRTLLSPFCTWSLGIMERWTRSWSRVSSYTDDRNDVQQTTSITDMDVRERSLVGRSPLAEWFRITNARFTDMLIANAGTKHIRHSEAGKDEISCKTSKSIVHCGSIFWQKLEFL
jgi:hypothetical protein